ncbi:hypothetical protein VAA049_1571 [Vibrio cholerae]|nr:hypothetical protein VAA049_1571 [Vibrio cholerae]EGR2420657.1 hypothetical protein [Vibrio cholerae]GIA35460.1 hypothetical protein VCSRO130_3546 [Vibrio cholerae]GIB93030.1 hypothetical protein VCSRO49_3383 [Vibrio cholerae]
MDIQNYLVILGGANIVLIALFTWLGKVWLNRIHLRDIRSIQVEIDQLKNELDKSLAFFNATNESKVHVSKIQFEIELSSYKELWALVSPICQRLKGCNNNMPLELMHKNALSIADKAYEITENKNRELYPFIDQSVYLAVECYLEELSKFRDCLRDESLFTELEQNASECRKNLVDTLIQYSEQLNLSSYEIAAEIRKRCRSMIIIG